MQDEGFQDVTPEDGGPVAGSTPSREERTLAMVAHACGVASSLLIVFVVPLVIWLTKKDESRFVAAQAREALNFHLTVFVVQVVVYLVCVATCVGIFLWPFLSGAVAIASVVLAVIAAIRTYDGEPYRYPVAMRPFA